jgi:hypothetical protein
VHSPTKVICHGKLRADNYPAQRWVNHSKLVASGCDHISQVTCHLIADALNLFKLNLLPYHHIGVPRMHHCLQIYDILALICEASLYQKYQKYWGNNECVLDRPSLLALLKTCRSFSVPATKLLWRNLPGLVPLMFTMPKDLVEVKTVFGKVEELVGLRYSQVGPQRVVCPIQLTAF